MAVILNSIDVDNISYGKDAGNILIGINLTEDGETFDAVYCLSPDDPFGFAPFLRKWLAENDGSYVIKPYVPPTPEQSRAAMPPLTARQFRLGLVAGGFTPTQVTATIEAMPDGPEKESARIEWEYATTFNRTHPLIAMVGAALGLSDEQIDAMWTAAVSL